MWIRLRTVARGGYQQFQNFWNSNSGDWTWLAENPVSLASLNRSLWRSSVPSLNFYILLLLSGAIATLGLLANSAATIIGAMIVAPLMGPIVSMAFAMVVGNRRLLKRSSLTLWTGAVMTILTALVVCKLIGLTTLNPEIISRVRPTLIDLGVALAAGAAGAYAKSRRGIADALPGVAIAVALVPPLSVIGIGLALASRTVAVGASLLFLANITGIIFSGGLVFLLQRYGTLTKAREGLTFSIVALFLLGVPLLLSLQNLLVRENVRRNVDELIRTSTVTFSRTDVRSVQVQQQDQILLVNLEVAAPYNSISEYQVNLVRDFLEKQLKTPVTLEVQVIPLTEFTAPAVIEEQ